MLTFSVNTNINKVILDNTFTDEKPTTELGRAWLSEVWLKAAEEKTDENINIDAYAYSCEKNTKMAVSKKEVAMLTTEEMQNGGRGVADTVARFVDTNVDAIIESSEVRTLVTEFMEVYDQLIIEEGVNLWKVIQLAREAVPTMIDKLRYLISTHNIGELVENVLKNPECITELEVAMA